MPREGRRIVDWSRLRNKIQSVCIPCRLLTYDPLVAGSRALCPPVAVERSESIDWVSTRSDCRVTVGKPTLSTALGVTEYGVEVDNPLHDGSTSRTLGSLVAVVTPTSIASSLGLGGFSGQDSESEGSDSDEWERFVHCYSQLKYGSDCCLTTHSHGHGLPDKFF